MEELNSRDDANDTQGTISIWSLLKCVQYLSAPSGKNGACTECDSSIAPFSKKINKKKNYKIRFF